METGGGWPVGGGEEGCVGQRGGTRRLTIRLLSRRHPLHRCCLLWAAAAAAVAMTAAAVASTVTAAAAREAEHVRSSRDTAGARCWCDAGAPPPPPTKFCPRGGRTSPAAIAPPLRTSATRWCVGGGVAGGVRMAAWEAAHTADGGAGGRPRARRWLPAVRGLHPPPALVREGGGGHSGGQVTAAGGSGRPGCEPWHPRRGWRRWRRRRQTERRRPCRRLRSCWCGPRGDP